MGLSPLEGDPGQTDRQRPRLTRPDALKENGPHLCQSGRGRSVVLSLTYNRENQDRASLAALPEIIIPPRGAHFNTPFTVKSVLKSALAYYPSFRPSAGFPHIPVIFTERDTPTFVISTGECRVFKTVDTHCFAARGEQTPTSAFAVPEGGVVLTPHEKREAPKWRNLSLK